MLSFLESNISVKEYLKEKESLENRINDEINNNSDLEFLVSYLTSGEANYIDIYYNKKYKSYEIIENKSHASVNKYDELIKNVVHTIYFSFKIDNFKYKKIIGKELEGDVALYYDEKASFSKLRILPVNSKAVKQNLDKVTIINLRVNFNEVITKIDDFVNNMKN